MTNPLHRLIVEVINQGNVAVIDELLAPDFVDEDVFPGEEVVTRESFKDFVRTYRAAVPDLLFEAVQEDLVGDHCWGMYRMSGTMVGSFLGMGPTGKKAVNVLEMHWVHVNQQGQIDRHRGSGQDLHMFDQWGISNPFLK